jgi:transcriptional regulator with XRE-family HTH domain
VILRLLRTARKDAGLTQGQVASRLGYQTSAVSKMERGELRLDLVQLRDYCRAIGLSLVDFVLKVEAELSADESQRR